MSSLSFAAFERYDMAMTLVDEVEHAGDLAAAREAVSRGEPIEISIAGQQVTVDGTTAQAILEVLEHSVHGASVVVTALGSVLTTGQVAELLGVSRPTVVDLVDNGKLPGHMVGTHRRIRAFDALAYRDQQRAERHAAMDQFIAITEELGI